MRRGIERLADVAYAPSAGGSAGDSVFEVSSSSSVIIS